MINNPETSSKKDDENNLFNWWQKVKAIFLGQRMSPKKHFQHTEEVMVSSADTPIGNQSKLGDWLQAIDILVMLVQTVRRSPENKSNNEVDLEVLGASTYLFHIDRMLSKIRDQFEHIRAQEQFFQPQDPSSKLAIKQIQEIGEQCYQSILNLISIIQQVPLKKLYNDQFITQIHTLELEATALSGAIRNFNQTTYKAQAMLQLASIEEDLLRSLAQTPHSFSGPSFANSGYQPPGLLNTNEEYLRAKMASLSDTPNKNFIKGMIDVYQMLKKCYVINRKSVIRESIDKIAQHIEAIIDVVSQKELNKNQAYYHFNQIFHCIEILRFSANRDSRCSKNLFDKSKIAFFQLRKLCQQNPLGNEYLKQYSIRRITLLKPR